MINKKKANLFLIYYSVSYALKYPDRVISLILEEPWG